MILVTACFRRETRWIERRADLRLVRTRMGDQAAGNIDAMCLNRPAIEAILSTGFCGGLDGRMKTGDLFVADAVCHRGETVRLAADLVERARNALPSAARTVWTGPAVCTDVVVDVAAKRALAASGALAVDMESGPLARWALARGIPFLVVRAVLDPVDVELPFTRSLPVWRSAVRHPAATIGLARRSSRAGRALGQAVADVAESLKGVSR